MNKLMTLFLTASSLTQVLAADVDWIDGRKWTFEYMGSSIGYYVSGVSPSDGDVVIPSVWGTYNNRKVTGIYQYPFANCTQMRSITIPSTINNLDGRAFEGCSSLSGMVWLCDGGTSSFITNYCKSLTWVCWPSNTNNRTFPSSVDVFRWCKTSKWQYSGSDGSGSGQTISITPTSRNIGVGGAGKAIITSGSGTTWTASRIFSGFSGGNDWVTLSASSGTIGNPINYTVTATTFVEPRSMEIMVTGSNNSAYDTVYHIVTQDGLGASISPASVEIAYSPRMTVGTISVTTPVNYAQWNAHSDVDWILLDGTGGVGSGTINYCVLPYHEVSTRSATITVAGNTFSVFQYGKPMMLDSYKATEDYQTHVIPISVTALATTQWSVTRNNSWIDIVDAGNGHGGDLVTISIGENPSYKTRTGTVSIGTETFTVIQAGRPTSALSFSVAPADSTASVEGAYATLAVTATPDLPWTVTSWPNWCPIVGNTASGSGNGNIVYSASPNPTLEQRTGTITVQPEAASGLAAKTHTVTQPGATAAISSLGYEFEAGGEPCSVDVSVADIVGWSISESLDWITVSGSNSRKGPGTVVIQALANDTIYSRSGIVKIAGKNFSVSQKGRGVEVEYDAKLFDTDGDQGSLSVHPDGNVAWTAVSSDVSWITITGGGSGTGDGEVIYIVSPYVGDGTARVGWITVGDKKVYITQRAYDLSISPNGSYVAGNSNAGEFGVSATIGDVWNAIATAPWIKVISGYDSGTGSGTVRFTYEDNDTGKMRTGKIIVNGEVYTLQQRARQMVAIGATAEHGGQVSGGGAYDLGEQVTLTAVPDSGYSFSYWTGAVSSMQNPLVLTADVAKSVKAVFAPMPIAFTSVKSGEDGVSLAWNNLAWAITYRIYRGVTTVPGTATVLAELPNGGNCTYLDESGDVDVEYWYWIEAEGVSDEVMSDPMMGKKLKAIVYSPITYTNLRGATNPNPAMYQEGTLVTFENPGSVTGYTFAGWTPSQITTDMTGAQAVSASWTANNYSIAYNPNGGSGTMNPTAAMYDSEVALAANGFTLAGHTFRGWATSATGPAVYAAGQLVTNLTAQSGGVVTLFASWEINRYAVVIDGVQTIVDYGTEYPVSAPAPYTDHAGTTQYVPVGTSAYPDRGTNFTISVLGDVSLSWDIWRTNHWLEVEIDAVGTGTVTKNGLAVEGEWVEAGTEINLLASPAAGYEFASWYGDKNGGVEDGATLVVPMDAPRVVGARFAYVPVITEVADPVISPADGSTFSGASLTVSITCETPGATIYYSTNGVNPKETATYLYTGEFTITDTTTVKAKAVYGTLKSGVVSSTISKVAATAPAEPVIDPGDGSSFVGDSCVVTITCATSDAVIYYTTNGSNPKTTETNRYKGPFVITDTTTVKAVAKNADNELKSSVVSATIAKAVLTYANALGADGLTFVSGGASGVKWVVASDASADGGVAVKSGEIGDSDSTWIETTVKGTGTFSFKWRADCEDDDTTPTSATWDHVRVETNGVEVARIDGVTGWVGPVTIDIVEGATIRWTYEKDASDSDGSDCTWIDAVTWTPTETIPAITDGESAETVNASVDSVGFADAAVKSVIGGSATEYNAFKTWADGVKGATGDALAGEAAVVANAHAAAAYLLGAERLFENEPTVEIEELAISDGESAGTTAMTVAVTVKDGDSAVAVSAAKVAAMFEATGDLGDWTGEAKLTPTVTTSGTDASGKMTFVVTPGDGTASKAFLRIKR